MTLGLVWAANIHMLTPVFLAQECLAVHLSLENLFDIFNIYSLIAKNDGAL